MIKKLQKRFIIITAISVFSVITLIFLFFNIFNYVSLNKQLDRINDRIIGFLSFRQDYLYTTDVKSEDLAFCTPRAWEMVSNILNNCDKPLILSVFGKNPIMYSRRYLLSNFNNNFNNSIPKISGKFDIVKFELPMLGGSIYAIDGGKLDADGSFNSLITSKKDFIDNLNSKGRFKVFDTTLKGWDLDIIKFELEQRKSVKGFEDTVLKNLKSVRMKP